MTNKTYKWDTLYDGNVKTLDQLLHTLLKNREIDEKEKQDEFFHPKHPKDITLSELAIDEKELEKAVDRLTQAIRNKESIIVYGDYDADGVCATAIMWQTLYSFNKNTIPFLPDRFIDGYGLHSESVKKLKEQNPDLTVIVTVDNGIVANDAVDTANELGIDVIISDHHQKGNEIPTACAFVHTDHICGSAVSWILARELSKKVSDGLSTTDTLLDLVAIGTIADQMPLVSSNRSFAKHGLSVLNNTKRCGLLALFESAAIEPGKIGTYEVNFLIAPRINAMGRLENAMDSLRLVCTTNDKKAKELAQTLGRINTERQKMVSEIVTHAKENALSREWKGVIVLAHETYHEGVIGLVASKLVEEYYRPAIVLSKKQGISKASARSIYGFNIIENIRKLDHLISGGGGHPMAAGFSIETDKIEEFQREMEALSEGLLTSDMLLRRIRVDCELAFELISKDLIDRLADFNPLGIGNPTPLFVTEGVYVEDANLIGAEKNHIKMRLTKDDKTFEAIAFHFGSMYNELSLQDQIDVVYSVEMNHWNGKSTIQLKVKDMKVH